jgi:hypothetical protein
MELDLPQGEILEEDRDVVGLLILIQAALHELEGGFGLARLQVCASKLVEGLDEVLLLLVAYLLLFLVQEVPVGHRLLEEGEGQVRLTLNLPEEHPVAVKVRDTIRPELLGLLEMGMSQLQPFAARVAAQKYLLVPRGVERVVGGIGETAVVVEIFGIPGDADLERFNFSNIDERKLQPAAKHIRMITCR